MNIAESLKHIFPDIDILNDVRISNKAIRSWNYSQPQPSEEELASAWEYLQSRKAQAQSVKTSLLEAWSNIFTLGEQAFLKPLYEAAMEKINAGDIAGVKTLIETAPSISEDLDNKRNSLLALFDNL